MNTDPNNQPVRESAVIDGGDPTEQEQALMDEGLDEKDTTADAAAAAEAAAKPDKPAGADTDTDAAAAAANPAEAGSADDAAAAAAEAAEAERLAAEKAEQDRKEAEAQAAQERANAEAKANADAIARVGQAEKPEPPVDFEKAFDELDKKLDDDDIDQAEYQKELRKLTRQEAEYAAKVTLWEGDQERLQREAQQAAERSQNAWNAAALKWEADNQEFMGNALRAKHMQEAIVLVQQHAAKEGKYLAPEVILTEAAKIAFEYTGYEPKQPVPAKDPKQEIAAAVSGRKPAQPVTTLGDVPNAGNEPIRGDEAFSRLDGLNIEDLEETVQRMSPDKLEDFLRDAPGAKAHGRDPVV